MADCMITPLKRILVIRRDNIGDLVCTTPLFNTLRSHYPTAQIDALVNSYNVQAIEHYPHLDNIYTYTKSKHRANDQSLLSVYWHRYKLIRKLRRQKYDLILLAGNFSQHAVRTAKSLNAKQTIGFHPSNDETSNLDIAVKPPFNIHHEVERTHHLLTTLSINSSPGALTLLPDSKVKNSLAKKLQDTEWSPQKHTIGLHISARKPSQRWPGENFAQLIRQLHAQYDCQFLLFWAPGDEKNPHHPGDNQKADRLLKQLKDLPAYPMHTQQLRDLIAGIDLCDQFICSDGGAMHIAAGLQKSLVCFFGDSDAKQWHPWVDNYQLIQTQSRDVIDISTEMAITAFEKLQTTLKSDKPD